MLYCAREKKNSIELVVVTVAIVVEVEVVVSLVVVVTVDVVISFDELTQSVKPTAATTPPTNKPVSNVIAGRIFLGFDGLRKNRS